MRLLNPSVRPDTRPAVDVLPPRGCDDEVAQLMDELSKLQTFLTLKGANADGRDFMAAADIVQRTRCLIVERAFKKPTLVNHGD